MRRIVIILAAATASVLAGAGTAAPAAQAQLVDRSHERITNTSEAQICGLDLVSTADFVLNQQERIARSGFPLFQGIANGTQTFTNPDTGKSITNQFAGVAFKDLSVTDNGDGTITLRTASAGLPEKLVLPDGTIVNMDVGQIVVVSVLDYNGTPTNADDDTLLSQSVVFQAGPHPDLDSNFELFCQNLVTYLT
jgi:FlaG/FlaF family flagellin (archaellin)